ncbi:bifunctional riboflavin kinase/FMN adenylyltransferase, partial [Candidatus Zixiibacteriota bacterium]
VILPFNRELSEMAAEDFVTGILCDAIGVKFLVLGHDHAFGKGRRGRPELLRLMAPEHGFDLEVVEAVRENGDPITSTLIRNHLHAGAVEQVRYLLGRPYGMRGLVEKGDQRGREIGWPTANIALPFPEKCVPGDGIYAVSTVVRDQVLTGACSVGVRPTFGFGIRTIEVHILDFDDDIYGESVEVRFHRKIRDEVAFDGVDELIEQIERDVVEARTILAQEEH